MNIEIMCEVKDRLHIDDLEPFQGELKTLSSSDYDRLKKQIIETGFAFPIYVWRNKGKNYIIGGHQRLRVLQTLAQNDEAHLPDDKVPVVYVQAEDFNAAKHRVLQDVAQYGTMQRQGLYEFMQESGIQIGAMMEDFRFPEIDLSGFNAEFFVDIEGKIGEGSKELKEIEFSKFQHQCPKCGFEFDDKK